MVTSALEKESREGPRSAGWEVVALSQGLRTASLRRPGAKTKRIFIFGPSQQRGPQGWGGRGLAGEFEDLLAGQCGWSRVTIGKRAEDLGG